MTVAHAAIVRQDPDKAELKTCISSCEEHILFCCMTLIRVLEEHRARVAVSSKDRQDTTRGFISSQQ